MEKRKININNHNIYNKEERIREKEEEFLQKE